MSELNRDDLKPVGYDYPLPVTAGYDTDLAINTSTVVNNAYTAAVSVYGGTSGKSIYITDLIISSGTALRADIQDSTGTVLLSVYLAANTPFEHSFVTPKPITAGSDLMLKTSVQGNVAISVDGLVR